MPDDKDDNNILTFSPRKKSKKNDKHGVGPKIEPVDIIATVAVLATLVVAVAMAGGWLPFNVFTAGFVGLSAVVAVVATFVRVRRTRASNSNRPPQRR
jgi:hypothetical protein